MGQFFLSSPLFSPFFHLFRSPLPFYLFFFISFLKVWGGGQLPLPPLIRPWLCSGGPYHSKFHPFIQNQKKNDGIQLFLWFYELLYKPWPQSGARSSLGPNIFQFAIERGHVRIYSTILQKCGHEEIKMKFRLVRRPFNRQVLQKTTRPAFLTFRKALDNILVAKGAGSCEYLFREIPGSTSIKRVRNIIIIHRYRITIIILIYIIYYKTKKTLIKKNHLTSNSLELKKQKHNSIFNLNHLNRNIFGKPKTSIYI